jgi:hypothetical protein
MKRDQILATGLPSWWSRPCHNCWDAIRDLEEVYHIGIEMGVFESRCCWRWSSSRITSSPRRKKRSKRPLQKGGQW